MKKTQISPGPFHALQSKGNEKQVYFFLFRIEIVAAVNA